MDRYWLLSNTCYGNWLPSDFRGFVGHVMEHRQHDAAAERRIVHDAPGTHYDEEMPGLQQAEQEIVLGPPVCLTRDHAKVTFRQFQGTSRVRRWPIETVAIMFNHFHLVVGVLGDPEPGKILGDFRSWATRALNNRFGAPPSETWWTERGFKRKLSNARALAAAVQYVLYGQRPALC